MEKEEFERFCQALGNGEPRYVENLKWRYKGKVIACAADSVKVEAFGHHFDWPAQMCREARGDVSALGPPSSTRGGV